MTLDLVETIAFEVGVTALAYHPQKNALEAGLENGRLALLTLNDNNIWKIQKMVDDQLCPSGSITALQWRPSNKSDESDYIAVSSHDHTVRVISLKI